MSAPGEKTHDQPWGNDGDNSKDRWCLVSAADDVFLAVMSMDWSVSSACIGQLNCNGDYKCSWMVETEQAQTSQLKRASA